LSRRATLGMNTAAAELAVGILCGLYACRDDSGESLIEYCPDYPAERAASDTPEGDGPRSSAARFSASVSSAASRGRSQSGAVSRSRTLPPAVRDLGKLLLAANSDLPRSRLRKGQILLKYCRPILPLRGPRPSKRAPIALLA
jgi:hypothetical protein